MNISRKEWEKFIKRLGAIEGKSAEIMERFLEESGWDVGHDTSALIAQSLSTAQYYGEGAAAAACEFYDQVAAKSKRYIPPAEPAPVPDYGEVAKVINGISKSGSVKEVAPAVGRLVKRTGVDTTMRNAIRDGAEWAWVPNGDTCAFCLALASRGWQRASKRALKNGHADHIHKNCNCTYAVRFGSGGGVEGYNPDAYKRIYANASGSDSREKINSIRREIEHKKQNASTNVSEGKVFAGNKSLEWHWEKHKAEFPEMTMEDYLNRAQELLEEPLQSGILEEIKRSDGSVSRYHFKNNEFVASTENGNIRSFFRPKNGKEYWKYEYERNK